MTDLKPCPNLIIMGAQKSGTTSLYEYLKVHPDIFMSSPIKEPGYYLGDERAKIFWKRMGQPIGSRQELLEERMLQGYQGETWFGDASTYYTIGERSRLYSIPQRMHAANSDMRFIYILRNPLDRIVSNYLHCLARKRFSGTIDDFLTTKEGQNSISTSRYFYQLQPYMEQFDRDQFCILIFEEFIQAPDLGMAKLWEFLDLEAPPRSPDYSPHNVSRNREQLADNETQLPEAELTSIKSALEADVSAFKSVLGRDIPSWPTF